MKAISYTCNKFALDVSNQLTTHRNKQFEQQKVHEQRITRLTQSYEAHITCTLKSHEEDITRVLTGRQGIWLSNHGTKILFAFLAVYTILVILFVRLG